MMELLEAIHLFYDAFVAPWGECRRGVRVHPKSWQTLDLYGEKVRYFYAESGVYVFDRGFDTCTITRGRSPLDAWNRAMGVVR